MSEMIRQGSEYTDREILTSLKQDIADINAKIDLLIDSNWKQREINMVQGKINAVVEHHALILAPRDEVAH